MLLRLSIRGAMWFSLVATVALQPLVATAQYNGVLVVGVPDFDDSAAVIDSGAISLLHSVQDTGVSTTFSQFFDQNSTDFQTAPQSADSFGQSVVVGDFNGDIVPDIAIGIPWEDIGGQSGAGMVQVVYGTVLGFIGYTEEALHHASPGIEGNPCYRCQFGSALAVGDFNGDGFDDLAVGSPEYYLDMVVGDSGAVNVIYGATGGFSAANDQLWTQDSTDILEEAYDGDYFGAALAAGDFDGDGYDDLAIGVPNEAVDGGLFSEEGAVNVLYGSAVGLSAARNQLWSQGHGLEDSPEDNDHFGAVLAVGDFDGNGYDDLVVSAPDESLPGAVDTGVVHVISGWGGLGLVNWNDELWSQNSAGMPDDAEEADHFGAALAAGDFDGDGYDDLAIGVPYEDLYEYTPDFMYEPGAVHVLHGSSTLLEVAGNLSFVQGVPTVPGTADDYEHFGQALAAADFNGDGYSDLVIAVPGDDPDAVVDAGAVHVLYGSPDSVASYVTQYWHLGVPGVSGINQVDAAFGASLAATNFSLLFACDFERGDSLGWSATVQ